MPKKLQLTDEQAIEAYTLATSGGLTRDIADKFGVSQTTITNIVLGKSYQHLNLEPKMRRTFLGGAWNASVEDRMKAAFVVDPVTGCHNWIRAKTGSGYGAIVINQRTLCAHRIAFELANGPIGDDAFVLHNCDNPACVNPAHMRLGTHEDNMHDKIVRSRVPAGECHYNSSINKDQALEIVRLFSDGKTGKEVMEITGLSKGVIYNVKYGKSWNTVTGLPRYKYKSRSKYLNVCFISCLIFSGILISRRLKQWNLFPTD